MAHFNSLYFILTEAQSKRYTDEVNESISSEYFVQICSETKFSSQ